MSLATMLFVAVCNIGWDGFSNEVSYNINLIAIGVVAFGCTVQQASYYGFTGCLPPRYTQAVMAGESKFKLLSKNFFMSLQKLTIFFISASIKL